MSKPQKIRYKKRGQTTVTCCSKGVGPWPCIPGERSRQPKADKERGSGPGVFTYGQSAAGAVAPTCFTHPHPYGREQRKTKKAQSLSHQIAGCSRGGSPRSLPSAGRVTKTSKPKSSHLFLLFLTRRKIQVKKQKPQFVSAVALTVAYK